MLPSSRSSTSGGCCSGRWPDCSGRWAAGWDPTLAIVITGLVFALFHFEALQYAGLALFGIILSFVSYRTGRLGMNMVAHASFNLTAVLAAVVVPLALVHGTVV